MSDNKYTSRDIYLDKTVKDYNRKIIFSAGLVILYWFMILLIIIGWIINWIKNDTFTFMQMFKWTLENYWYAYLYILIFKFGIRKSIIRNAKERDNFLRQQYERNKERIDAIAKAEASSAYNVKSDDK